MNPFVLFLVHLLPDITETAFQLWGQLEVDLLASSHISQCHLGKATTSGSLWVECFQPLYDIQASYVFLPPVLFPLVLSKILAENVIGQFRLFIKLAPPMVSTWCHTVLSMLVDIPHSCTVGQNLVMDLSVDQLLKGLPSLHLTLAAQRCVLYRWGFSSWVCQAVAGVTQVSMTIVGSSARRNGPIGVLHRMYQMISFLPLKLANFLVHLFRVGLAWHRIGIYHFASLALRTFSSSQDFKSLYL